MDNNPHVGDIGKEFIVNILQADGITPMNVSTATTKQIVFQKPDGTILEVAASFYTNGTDGKIKYSTVLNDLSIEGTWNYQGYIVMSVWSGHTSVQYFTVDKNLK